MLLGVKRVLKKALSNLRLLIFLVESTNFSCCTLITLLNIIAISEGVNQILSTLRADSYSNHYYRNDYL